MKRKKFLKRLDKWDLQGVFADGLSDEAAWALRECLNNLLMTCECRYFHQLRRYSEQPQKQCDSERPWRTSEPF